jgi:hypothetical protein
MTKFYVYELVVVPDGNICYVGKGTRRRMYVHKRNIQYSRVNQTGLYRRLRDLLNSGKNFEPRKVFETEDEQAALAEEKRRIELYGLDNLFNSTTRQGLTIADIDDAHRQALSKSRREYIAKLQSETGRKMPLEVAVKISVSNTGRVVSPETTAKIQAALALDPANKEQARQQALKMCASHAGKKRSPVYCAKLSALRKGRPVTWGAAISNALVGKATRNKAKSAYRGVSWLSPKAAWQSRIQLDGKTKFLGQFKVEHEAAFAYDNAFESQHGLRPNNT